MDFNSSPGTMRRDSTPFKLQLSNQRSTVLLFIPKTFDDQLTRVFDGLEEGIDYVF